VPYNHVFGGVAVADFGAALPWYELLFGRPPDLIPKEDEAAWHLTETAWIYLVADSARAGRALITLLVDDLEQRVADLRERGLATGEIETAPGLFRKVVVTDPEGNMITFAEDLSRDD
jgi:catechol 2,3-dioxygenase-like lactoylglutathione lyase family enzyme